MPRPKVASVKTNVMIEQDVHDRLQVLLLNPKTGRQRYGALQKITNRLFRAFLAKLDQPETDITQYLKAYGIDLADGLNPEIHDDTTTHAQEQQDAQY